jgi:GntR family transcriptional regulator
VTAGRPGTYGNYRLIAEEIRRQVASGELRPGAAIPSYAQLAVQYGVSVSTAQRAVRLLKKWGCVVGRPGHGVYVTHPPQTGAAGRGGETAAGAAGLCRRCQGPLDGGAPGRGVTPRGAPVK